MDVSYEDAQLQQTVSDKFYFDIEPYRDAVMVESDISILKNSLTQLGKDLSKEIEKVHKATERLANISSPSGLDLSHFALRNLKAIADDEDLPKFDAKRCGFMVFRDELDIETGLALRIVRFLATKPEHRKFPIEGLDGMKPEILTRLQERFAFD